MDSGYINPLIKHTYIPYILSFCYMCSWCLRQAADSVQILSARAFTYSMCLSAAEANLGPPSAMGQLHVAQRDPLLWCEWKEPCCCRLMLFLATSPFQHRLHCWGTAGRMPGCLAGWLNPPFKASRLLNHLTSCSWQPRCCTAQLSCRKWSKKSWMLQHPVTSTCCHHFLSEDNTHLHTHTCTHKRNACKQSTGCTRQWDWY